MANVEMISRFPVLTERIHDLEDVKSYMSHLQQYTKISKIPTLQTYFSLNVEMISRFPVLTKSILSKLFEQIRSS
jgi:hypothetical protein